MKFVRTKSGRILTPIRYDSRVGDIYDGDETKDDEVVDTSDSIEDLCDDFVVILPNERPYFQYYKTLHTFDDIKANYLKILHVEPKTECYGAIWTNKGIPYVAKMNEKGELELI